MQYRISKYHPLFSKYVDDWAALTDVGDKRYDLTIEEYLNYENLYIQTVIDLLMLDKCEQLRISNFEKTIKWDSILSERYNLDKSVFELYKKDYQGKVYKELYSGKRFFDCSDFSALLKVLLREEAWFVISVDDYKIDVGYDYYIHIDTQKNLLKKSNLLTDGVYLEEL